MKKKYGLSMIEYFRVVGGQIPEAELTEKEKKYRKLMNKGLRKAIKQGKLNSSYTVIP